MKLGKLDPMAALTSLFIGYSSTQKGFQCCYPPTRKFCTLADVTFEEYAEKMASSNSGDLGNQIDAQEYQFLMLPKRVTLADSRMLESQTQGSDHGNVGVHNSPLIKTHNNVHQFWLRDQVQLIQV